MIVRFLVFLILNFGALALGALFTSDGVSSEWYSNVLKAPWTPPGWVFGAAWTSIMICFSFYMTVLWKKLKNKKTIALLFSLQWVLNVSWNPAFFYAHNAILGLFLISALTILITYFLFSYRRLVKANSLLIVPYFLWLLIATSLNAYIVIYN